MIGMRYQLTDIKLNQRGLYTTLKSPRGPVGMHIRAIGEETVILAKLFAGVKTTKLKRSIKMERDRTSIREYGVLVGSDVRHALVHHQGARPHRINARGGGVLRFKSKFGGVVVTQSVNHPGHKGNPYLVRALRIAVRSR